MTRILHLGDIHPNNNALFAGKLTIDPETGQNLALTDLRKSLAFCLRHARDRAFDLALLTGDVFDNHKPHPNEIQVIREFLQELADHMPVIAIPGNHDMSQNPQDATALEALKGIENVQIVERPTVIEPQVPGAGRIQVFCLPYPTKGRLLTHEASLGKSPEEITAQINHGLGAILQLFVVDRAAGATHILMAHGTVGGVTVGEQPRSLDHDIMIPQETFLAFTYVALGHIHQPQVIGSAHYSGSLMRSGFGEENEDKGFKVVEFEPGHPCQVTHIKNPHARTYITLGAPHFEEHDYPDGLQDDIVWRFKDTLTEEQERALRPTLNRLAGATRWFQMDIDRVEETRARDAGMTGVLNVDDALARALAGKATPEEMPALLEKHRGLEQAVG